MLVSGLLLLCTRMQHAKGEACYVLIKEVIQCKHVDSNFKRVLSGSVLW